MAAELKTRLIEDGELENDVACAVALVRSWEYLPIMEKDDADSALVALVDAELDLLILDGDSNVTSAPDASRVTREVSSLPLSISLVVWRDHSDLLPQLDKARRELIHHDTKAADCGPSTKLWCRKHDLSQLVTVKDGLCCAYRSKTLVVPASLLDYVARHR